MTGIVLVSLLSFAPTASAKCLYGAYSWDDHTDTYWHHGSGCKVGTDGLGCYESWDNHYNNGDPSTTHVEHCSTDFPTE